MSVVIIYDHFIAKGGAENVTMQLAEHLDADKVETAYADSELFETEIALGKLYSKGFKVARGFLNTPKLMLYFLLFYRLPRVNNVILSGIFAPLSAIRYGRSINKIIYFHMYPTFLDWSFDCLRSKFGGGGACFYWVFIEVYGLLLKLATYRSETVFCNSLITQKQFLRRGINAEILNPPVDIHGFERTNNNHYFLSTARLEDSKRVKLIADTFISLPSQKIIFVGGGSLLEEMKMRYVDYPNIKFTGWCTLEQTKDYYSNCKALIYIPQNEAFGIAPIEAMAAGKFVIGVAEGGLIETIKDSRLGCLICLPVDKEKLLASVHKVVDCCDSQEDVQFRKQQAKNYDKELFYTRIKQVLRP